MVDKFFLFYFRAHDALWMVKINVKVTLCSSSLHSDTSLAGVTPAGPPPDPGWAVNGWTSIDDCGGLNGCHRHPPAEELSHAVFLLLPSLFITML